MVPASPAGRLDYDTYIYFVKVELLRTVVALPPEFHAVEFEYNQEDLLPS